MKDRSGCYGVVALVGEATRAGLVEFAESVGRSGSLDFVVGRAFSPPHISLLHMRTELSYARDAFKAVAGVLNSDVDIAVGEFYIDPSPLGTWFGLSVEIPEFMWDVRATAMRRAVELGCGPVREGAWEVFRPHITLGRWQATTSPGYVEDCLRDFSIRAKIVFALIGEELGEVVEIL
jgi:hypothetical protein